jgi:hypothetical protein
VLRGGNVSGVGGGSVVSRCRVQFRIHELDGGIDAIEKRSEHLSRTLFALATQISLDLEFMSERHRHEEHALWMESTRDSELVELTVHDAGQTLKLRRAGAGDDAERLTADAKLDRRAIHGKQPSIRRS